MWKKNNVEIRFLFSTRLSMNPFDVRWDDVVYDECTVDFDEENLCDNIHN